MINTHGQQTAATAQSITEDLNKRGFDVYYDHGNPSNPFVGTIPISIETGLSSKTQLSQLDIVVVERGTFKAIALIEIEETTDVPKTLIGDICTTLMGNSVHLPGRNKIANVGKWTTLIVLGKGARHDERIKQINKIVNSAKLDFGTGNSRIGNIVIESFPRNEKLEKILAGHIDEAIRKYQEIQHVSRA